MWSVNTKLYLEIENKVTRKKKGILVIPFEKKTVHLKLM